MRIFKSFSITNKNMNKEKNKRIEEIINEALKEPKITKGYTAEELSQKINVPYPRVHLEYLEQGVIKNYKII